ALFSSCCRPSCLSFPSSAPAHHSPSSLHDALPILSSCCTTVCSRLRRLGSPVETNCVRSEYSILKSSTPLLRSANRSIRRRCSRSEEHTSELQSHLNLVCRLLLENQEASLDDGICD